MNYLLDTNVISETRRQRPDAQVMRWMQNADPSGLFLSVLTLGEIQKGISLKQRSDPSAAQKLQAWLGQIPSLFAEHILVFDQESSLKWGELAALRPLPVIDGMLAATCLAHDLTLVTRNSSHFINLGVRLVNPWKEV